MLVRYCRSMHGFALSLGGEINRFVALGIIILSYSNCNLCYILATSQITLDSTVAYEIPDLTCT